jgi:hypothetical protein
MKMPEFMFVIINPIMKFLLRSPLHGILSDSIMIIGFTGRKSGRQYETPVRYVRMAGNIRCYSSDDTMWWRNLRGGARVTLRIAGKDRPYFATVTENDPATIREALIHYFSIYPQDAAYHDVRMGSDGNPVENDIARAAQHAIVVDASPKSP